MISRTDSKEQRRERGVWENIKATKDLWGFGHRREYSSRLRAAGLKIVKGPNPLSEFWVREFESDGCKPSGWSSPGSTALRNLALAFWVGSEFDVAVVRIDPNGPGGASRTRGFHEFDALTNTILQMTHRFRWDGEGVCHRAEGPYDPANLITSLLTCYNAVFVDDITKQKSWVFFHNVLPVSVPQKIRIRRDDGDTAVYLQSETQKYTLNAGFDKPADRLPGSRRVHSLDDHASPDAGFEPFQVDLEKWKECGSEIANWLNREKLRGRQILQIDAMRIDAEQRRRKETAQDSLRHFLELNIANPLHRRKT